MLEHLGGTNGKMRADFVSFPDGADPAHFFASGKAEGAWHATLPDHYVQYLKQFQQGIPQFNQNITGMLFGQGNTSIYLLKTGFIADLNGEAEKEDHPLNKVPAFYKFKFLSHWDLIWI